jgi:hypothetical protein
MVRFRAPSVHQPPVSDREKDSDDENVINDDSSIDDIISVVQLEYCLPNALSIQRRGCSPHKSLSGNPSKYFLMNWAPAMVCFAHLQSSTWKQNIVLPLAHFHIWMIVVE